MWVMTVISVYHPCRGHSQTQRCGLSLLMALVFHSCSLVVIYAQGCQRMHGLSRLVCSGSGNSFILFLRKIHARLLMVCFVPSAVCSVFTEVTGQSRHSQSGWDWAHFPCELAKVEVFTDLPKVRPVPALLSWSLSLFISGPGDLVTPDHTPAAHPVLSSRKEGDWRERPKSSFF